MSKLETTKVPVKVDIPAQEVLDDYKLIIGSREASMIGRKEVFMGKAKFGIFGDGKEVAQVAMAKEFKEGDFRSGYYRDQTFMLAIGQLTIQQYFAQLYAHTDLEADPSSAGRLMNSHFSTRYLDQQGKWLPQIKLKNSSSDISPTAAQMPRMVGLALASKLYRSNPQLKKIKGFSQNGNEVVFGTIGNAATSEGHFFEAFNAAGVLQIPLIISVWDDDYGISVPQRYHTTKGDISKALEGFQRTKDEEGYEILTANGWDYPELIQVYRKAAMLSREKHIPVLVHVKEMTQPQGHSTSGSHERYKSKERLAWESEHDCIKKMREWILENELSDPDQLDEIEKEAKQSAKKARETAWKAYIQSIKEDQDTATQLLEKLSRESKHGHQIQLVIEELEKTLNPIRQDAIRGVKKALRIVRKERIPARFKLIQWLKDEMQSNYERYSSHLYSESEESALAVKSKPPVYNAESKLVDGREVLQACFDAALSRDPRVLAFGEDVGQIGDVNQAFAELQSKYGELRVSDTGIRETTIIGKGIGLAMRGLKPIAEIQYLDYLIYALQTLSDDLATLHYRTKGGQKAPLIIRTRGHRLEGVWHSGSPMGMIINSLRGIYILVPRNMIQAAGLYNTLLLSDDPALMIECLNGYRLKERIPENIGEFTVPLGIPDILREGNDVTIVTYGSMCRIVMDAAKQLQEFGISCEVIDAQTLIPFDLPQMILDSLKKTNRIVFADEDLPGGASAYMMRQVLEEQNGYHYLDSKPITITGAQHRPAYASDGDYFSKPNVEQVFDAVYELIAESDPDKFPDLYPGK